MNPSCWLVIEGHIARLNLPKLSLAFDADRPADGLKNIIALERPWPMGRLLGVSGSIQSAASCALTDWHVRGDDLIAVYETGQPDAARIDMLWRRRALRRRSRVRANRSLGFHSHRPARLAVRHRP